MYLPSVDFSRIRAIGAGGQRAGFEQFVCELAAADRPHRDASFTRLDGAGGDGGLECYWTLPDSSEVGWQSKYWVRVGDVSKAQLDASVRMALKTHTNLSRYTIAIPVDPTGPTERPGKSLKEKVDGWLEGWKALAVEAGMSVKFTVEWSTHLISRLRAIDPSGIRIYYWFSIDVLPDGWWDARLNEAVHAARPRYIPELSIDVPAATAIAALCGDSEWQDLVDHERYLLSYWRTFSGVRAVGHANAEIEVVFKRVDDLERALFAWRNSLNDAGCEVESTRHAVQLAAAAAEQKESAEMRRRYGSWDTAVWRDAQEDFFPPHLAIDGLRWLQQFLSRIDDLLSATFSHSTDSTVALITGAAGSGKTFVVCDVVSRRLSTGRPSLLMHGRWFGVGDLLLQLRDHLQLPATLTGEETLALLDQAGRVAGCPLLLVIDALNETHPRVTWIDQVDKIATLLSKFHHIQVVLTVRSHYHDDVVPTDLRLRTFNHRGFDGVEFDAITEYADFYGLEPPTVPPVHGEFNNPLFLRLLCEALKDRGRASLDQGSLALDDLVELLLDSTNARISRQLGAAPTDRIVHRAMTNLARAGSSAPNAVVPRPVATDIVYEIWPEHASDRSLLEGLIAEGLLAEDVVPDPRGRAQAVVVPAFERLGQHLVIAEAIRELATVGEVRDALGGGNLRLLLRLDDGPDRGLIEALSVAVAQKFGVELTRFADLIADDTAVLSAILAGIPWRTASSISDETGAAVRNALYSTATFTDAMQLLFHLAARPGHPLNADFLHGLLVSHSMADRDSWLVPWLLSALGRDGPTDRLVTWARERDIDLVGSETCRLWVAALLWCTGTPDYRLRDGATIAAARLLARHVEQAPNLLARFATLDDDWIVERALAVAYGALLLSGTNREWREAAAISRSTVFGDRPTTNAQVRDEARGIIETAAAYGTLDRGFDLQAVRPPYRSSWPIAATRRSDVAMYRNGTRYPGLHSDCTNGDFYKHVRWVFGDKWRSLSGGPRVRVDVPSLARRVLLDVIEMGYRPALHADFDAHVMRSYGKGRALEPLVDRIGKKYQWIAFSRIEGAACDHSEQDSGRSDLRGTRPDPQSSGRRRVDTTVCEPDTERAPRSWLPSYDWLRVKDVSDSEWLLDAGDLPDPPVEIPTSAGVRVILDAHLAWESDEPGLSEPHGTRRSLGGDIRSILVRADQLSFLLDDMRGRDLAGLENMPFNILQSGFVGEYPHGLHLAREIRHVDNGHRREPYPVRVWPASYHLSPHESSTDRTISLDAPAPVLCGSPLDGLRWDGRTAWIDREGQSIASVWHATGVGPNDLTVDRRWLRERLQSTDLRLVWIEVVRKDFYSGLSRGLVRTRVHYLTDVSVEHLDPVYTEVSHERDCDFD